MKSMPLFYYPSQVTWVDDDELFLQSVMERFKNVFKIKAFTSPEQGLVALKNNFSIAASFPLLKANKNNEEYGLIDHMPVDINLNSIQELRNNEERYQETTVLVVDYNMPQKTGIELCRELRDSPIKKILLTGEASHRFAVEAFNEGIIDCFIRKDEPTLADDLIENIKRLQQEFFIETSRYLLSHLEVDYKLPHSDPCFINYFESWKQKNNIDEYYLIDRNGTFLTFNKDGDMQYFVTHTDRSLEAFENLYAKDIEVSNFVSEVNRREKIPFFGPNNESWDYDFTQWDNYFYQPNFFEGREKYYWFVERAVI